ncbi:MAG TPA: GH92 family glycosyl hydrolase, partial [Bacteroidia bacterium]|nr:GH92 family glycosyl hydrolase [Bacteroidia bacterium]
TFTADSSSNKDLRVSFTFETKQPVLVKVALSPVSCANAKLNMETEVPGWDFEDLRKKVRNDWNTELSKIEVQETSLSKKRIFYTALYHCFIAPNIYCDVNGDYMGRDKKIHRDTAHAQYTVFSLWDTYRALHPLFTIVQPERNRDFIHTFLKQYKEGGRLPVWELSANETDCMIGYHSVSVIVDAWMKGQTDFDTALAYEAMKASAMADERGLKSYKKCGYIPAEAEGESVSKTLEYAYDDWCIMQAAERMGNKEDFLYFMLRAQSWRNVFDEQTRFMRARFNNSFMEPFDPGEVNAHFTEANAWQYSLAVQQDVNGLIYSMGGNEAFLKHLDKLFSASSGTSGRKQPDITGLIGQYAHGNEPSHHMAYLACNAESPFIAQDFIRRIMNDLYSDQPDGLCGNEDCGQMSAWYVLSALGFYQVTPGLDQFVIGIPAFEEVILNFGNKKTKLTVRGAYPDETYLIGTWINGKNNNKGWFTLADITTGSQIDYIMSAGPVSEDNAYDALDMTTHSPFSGILIPAAPRIQSGQGKSFEDELKIELITNVSDPVISYRLNDGSPQQYSGPFLIRENTKLEAWASNDPDKFEISYGMSGISYAEFIKAPGWKVISITHPYAAQYSAGGKNALVDGIRGGLNFRSGEWQGYEKNDMEVVIDLGSRKQITGVSCGFLQDPGVWIWLPEEVVFYASEDGKKFTRYDLYKNTTNEKINSTENCASGKLQKARYIKLVAKNRGTCPAWHPGNGKPCWLFADEIIIETK